MFLISKSMVFLIVLVLESCTSLKWKYNYIGTRLQSLKKYTIDKDSSIILSIPSDFRVEKKIKRSRKRKIMFMMNKIERGAAMFPDSLVRSGNRTDSFYYNINKIKFIKENRLQTRNIHFVN